MAAVCMEAPDIPNALSRNPRLLLQNSRVLGFGVSRARIGALALRDVKSVSERGNWVVFGGFWDSLLRVPCRSTSKPASFFETLRCQRVALLKFPGVYMSFF